MNTATKKIHLVSTSLLAVLLLALFLIPAFANVKAAIFNPISGQLQVGSTGTDVTYLQTFLASSAYVYPQARVTGYYGTLTANAVAQFQIAYGLPSVGRVGPLTLAKINSVIAAGYGIDISAPLISNVSVQTGKNSTIISWTANEPASGKVYYSVSPLLLGEASANFAEPTILGSVSSLQTSGVGNSQTINITNLQSGTLYYYMIVSTDPSGNVSVTPPTTFTTTP